MWVPHGEATSDVQLGSMLLSAEDCVVQLTVVMRSETPRQPVCGGLPVSRGYGSTHMAFSSLIHIMFVICQQLRRSSIFRALLSQLRELAGI